MTALVTGATGFVGRVLVADLLARGEAVRATVRPGREHVVDPRANVVTIGEPTNKAAWQAAVADVDVVYHLLGRAHQTRERASAGASEHRRVNFEVTAQLARAARDAGVRRMVYASTAKVTEDPRALRGDPYAASKWEAEQAALDALGPERLAVIRPPLVYGPLVRANFLALMRWVASGLPIPLGAVDNRRSLIYVGNLADALCWLGALGSPAGPWFAADDEVVSTAELVHQIAEALRVPARLWSIPPRWLWALGAATGRKGTIERLVGSLVVDDAAIRQSGWRPPFSRREGLAATAAWFHTVY